MPKTTYTREEAQDMAVSLFEIITSLPRDPAFWDSLAGERDSAALDLFHLAETLDSVAEADGVRWGDTHDYYLATEHLAALYAEHSMAHGIVHTQAEADALVHAALAAPGVAYPQQSEEK